jgi:hypothetical protein
VAIPLQVEELLDIAVGLFEEIQPGLDVVSD